VSAAIGLCVMLGALLAAIASAVRFRRARCPSVLRFGIPSSSESRCACGRSTHRHQSAASTSLPGGQRSCS